MFRLVIEDYAQNDWNRLIGDFPDLSLLQCWEYAEAKARTGPWRVERGVFKDGEQVVGAFQALLRPLPAGLPGGLAWINRGPLLRSRDGDGMGRLVEMMGQLRRHYADGRGMYLRLAPPTAEGTLTQAALSAAGLSVAECPGWASAVLDLTPPEETLRANLKGKWRGPLNKGERESLEVRSGRGEVFAAFLESHHKMIAEKDLATSVTADLLRALQDLLNGDNRMEAFLATHEGAPVASVLIAKYGHTCEYLAGNVSDQGRRLSAGHLLLWQAILAMKEQGMRRFDVGGMDPQLTPEGILRFKRGLSAEPYRLTPEVEAVGGLLGRLVRWRVTRARAAG